MSCSRREFLLTSLMALGAATMVGDIVAADNTYTRRKLEVLRYGGWGPYNMRKIKAGNIFRMFEPNGELVTDRLGYSEFVAIKDAKYEYGVWGVESESYTEDNRIIASRKILGIETRKR